MQKLGVAILGATGAVGQRFIQLLENHPWFYVAEVIGSSRSAGQPYGEITNWVLDGNVPDSVSHLTVKPLDGNFDSPLIFSALPKEAAETREIELAAAGHIVCTNASANRMVDDFPLLLPEVNHDHIKLIDVQREKRGWKTGAVIANSNCTAMPVVMALAPLRQFGITKIIVVSAQAISGAGYPGVASLDILDNMIPYVSGDEQKLETETLRMLGSYQNEQISWMDAKLSASCNRVPVIDGHLVNVSVELRANPRLNEIIDIWTNFRASAEVANLPSAPEHPLYYMPQIDRPQSRRDRNAGKGMSTSIGRLRECPILGYKFAALSHNTIRGAAGCSILNAELIASSGYIAAFTREKTLSAG
ncbi:MAG: aspartate-semialdehyde dehydrogenase [Chloroflexi bacterium]|nr:aspartate-semialdehyde dehydrogenase [Chloroflexota bacterium]MCC6891314.1 aspartate-semialdehyde dehydrogenase [Anaerolineae bacterium]